MTEEGAAIRETNLLAHGQFCFAQKTPSNFVFFFIHFTFLCDAIEATMEKGASWNISPSGVVGEGRLVEEALEV